MVCKNCGADLKPGIKYCLNCGYYIDEDDLVELDGGETDLTPVESVSEEVSIPEDSNDSFKLEDVSESSTKKKKRKLNMTTKDIIIYVVLIFAPKTKKTQVITTPSPTILEDNVVKVSDYEVTFSGDLRYTVEGKNLFITDGKNYTFSYNITKADFNKYSSDLSLLSSDLEKKGYKVLGSEKRTVDMSDIIIYNLKVEDDTKYFYMIKVDSMRIAMGTIENVENGNWSLALDEIVKLGKTIKFDSSSSDDDIDNFIENVSSCLSKGIKK